MIVEYCNETLGFHFRSVFLPFKGMTIPQHEHDVSHPTLCGSGKARLYVDGRFTEDVEAGGIVEIAAGKKHMFEALEDNTRLTCVFNAEQAEKLKGDGF
jgi:quercetin dioxygenase-like cupin family protein